MLHTHQIHLINSVIEACVDEIAQRGLLLSQTTRLLFSMVEEGESDFEVLRQALLDQVGSSELPSPAAAAPLKEGG